MKRVFDMAISCVGLVLLLPLYVGLWCLVVVESGRPGFFCQQRIGRGGRPFMLHKFRTMTVLQGAEQGSFEAGSSTRVTSVGKIFRKWKLDELPQLWNVAKGDMSLVGPRPEVKKWVDEYPARWAKVHVVRPGITDPASIEFRNEEEMLAASRNPEHTYRELILPRKLDLYEHYVQHRSLLGDLGILAKTFWTVLKK